MSNRDRHHREERRFWSTRAQLRTLSLLAGILTAALWLIGTATYHGTLWLLDHWPAR